MLQTIGGHNQRGCLSGHAIAQRFDAPNGKLAAGRRRFQKGNVPCGQVSRAAVEQKIQILRHALRRELVGFDDQRRTLRRAHQRRDQMSALRVVRTIHHPNARGFYAIFQLAKRFKPVKRLKQAV